MPKIARRMATNSSKLNILTSNPSINSRIKMLITIRNTLPPSSDVPEIEILWFIQYAFVRGSWGSGCFNTFWGALSGAIFAFCFFAIQKESERILKHFPSSFILGASEKNKSTLLGPVKKRNVCQNSCGDYSPLPKRNWNSFESTFNGMENPLKKIVFNCFSFRWLWMLFPQRIFKNRGNFLFLSSPETLWDFFFSHRVLLKFQ